jgi:hypothetical protein
MRKLITAAAVAGLVAACGGDGRDDDVLQQDTTLLIQPDTMLIERTITEDTIRDPDLRRDTLNDTLRAPQP